MTTARHPECKRGIAVNLAASLARQGAGRVCVVDVDPLAHDVTTRLPARGALLDDFAGRTPPRPDQIGRLAHPPLAVLACGDIGLGRVRYAADRALPMLRKEFDVVVADLVGGPNGPGRVVGARLDVLDVLLVCVTPEPGAVAATAHFLEHVGTARRRGAISADVRIELVCTGDENSTVMSVADVADALGRPVAGSIPQLWGRAEPNLGFGAALAIPELDDAVLDLMAVCRSGASVEPGGLIRLP